jgi:hypothetical protein
MAAFALLGLSIALGVVALAGLRPWATSSVVPNLTLSPAIGTALGDATVVAQADSPEVGSGGTVAPLSPPAAAVSPPGGVPVPKQHVSGSPVLAIAPARALSVAEPAPAAAPPAPEPEPATSPNPVAVTAPPPVDPAPLAVAPQPAAPGAPVASGGPSTAGVGGGVLGPSCEGGEYLITVTLEEEETDEEGYGQSEADILIQGEGADGSEVELELRGDLSDVHSLVETLVSEGSCVRVEIVPFADGEPSPEAGEPGVVPVEPGDVAEPALP